MAAQVQQDGGELLLGLTDSLSTLTIGPPGFEQVATRGLQFM